MAQLPNRSSLLGTNEGIEVPQVEHKGWNMTYPPDVLLFGAQVLTIFCVVLAALINLSFNIGNQQIWTVILTGSLGYLMPNPKIKVINRGDRRIVSDASTSTSSSSVSDKVPLETEV